MKNSRKNFNSPKNQKCIESHCPDEKNGSPIVNILTEVNSNTINSFMVKEPIASDDSSSYSMTLSEFEEDRWHNPTSLTNETTDVENIQRLIKYIRVGNQTATAIALAALGDYDLGDETIQSIVISFGGTDLLINLLETDHNECRHGALAILHEMSFLLGTRRNLTNLGAIPILVNLLSDRSSDIQILAAETLANIAMIRKGRKFIRKAGGIKLMVKYMDVQDHILKTDNDLLLPAQQKSLTLLCKCSQAIWFISKSDKNKDAMRYSGIIPVMAKLLNSIHKNVVSSIMGVIVNCATQSVFRNAIKEEGMLIDILKLLKSPDPLMLQNAAEITLYCAEDLESRKLIKEQGGLNSLVNIVKVESHRSDVKLMEAATGAIWKCLMNSDNVKRLEDINGIHVLVKLLDSDSEQVIANTVASMAECTKICRNKVALRAADGLVPMIKLLQNSNHEQLLINVCRVVNNCATDPQCIEQIINNDGIRLVWSMMKFDSTMVQSTAGHTLVTLLKNTKNSSDIMSSLVTGLVMLVDLLKSCDTDVLAATCAVIGILAKESENLAILTDYDIVQRLSTLVYTNNADLQAHLSRAIGSCCLLSRNCHIFGKLDVVLPISKYIYSTSELVKENVTFALYGLSGDASNCIAMESCGVVPFLMETISSKDPDVQEASAGCLANIRKIALNIRNYQ
ncbi:armadillo repeat-containing protein gudu-like isoform X2 [Daktulosphaira vitifoliae]|uniref:armadillo repeat-containing protein gudu-like isoform X2 n=1 Tax=Daktulosphaira vitifoliae TaxID=58002 RepID=UPI0021AAC0B4|nr:armadillo repeat-containing protein gudu-like isoform X2 [Daktulosphaira vitifoliae]